MKILKISLVAFLLVLGANKIKACHGLPLQNYVVTVGATGVTINANSDPSTCGCGPYWLQTEISCTPAFLGTQPACLTNTLTNWNNVTTSYVSFPYFNSLLNVAGYSIGSGWSDNCVSEPYHPNVIPFSSLCPGKVYYIRSREMVLGGGNTGPWTAVQSFTVPGIAPPPGAGALTLGLNAAPGTIICGGGTALTPTWAGSCPNSCAPTFPSCEATTTIVPSYSFVATNPVLPGLVTTTVVPAGTSASVITIPSLTSPTTFSVYFVYKVISLGGIVSYSATSGPGAFPINLGNTTNSFVTAPAGSVYMNAFLNCNLSTCNITQPGVVFVNVINTLPVANVTITPNACLSTPSFTFTDLNAVAGMNYNWNFGDGTSAIGSPAIHSYTAAGIYTVSMVKSGGAACTPLTTSYTVEVYPNPTINISVNSPVCYGGTISFTNAVTNGNTYNWTGPNSFVSALQNPVITNATSNISGVYYCTVTSVHSCTASANINVTTFQAPLAINSNSTICAGSNLNLTASGTGNYSWTGPNGFTSNQQNPVLIPTSALASGNYIVNAVLAGNCSASATTAVIVNTTNVTASNNGPVCSGNNLQLNANGVGTFVWSGPNGFSSTQQNPLLSGVTSSASGVYTVTITSPQGCTQTATTNVFIQAPKVLQPKSTGTMCEDGVITLESMDAGGITYLWSGPNGFTATTAQISIQDVTPAMSGVYTIQLVDPLGCIASGTTQVTVYPKPNVDIDMSKATAGCEPRNNMEFKAIGNTFNGMTYEWNLGNGVTNSSDNPKNVNYTTANTYTISLIAKNAYGCVAKKTKTFEVYPMPVVNFSNTPNPSFTNPQVNFTDLSYNGNITNWNWTFGAGNDASSSQQHPTYVYQDSGMYLVTLKVKTERGCENSTSKKVLISDEGGLFLPNAFTPNGDGQNDVFMAVANNIGKFEMLIFNRGGSLVFQSNDIKKGWDGTFKGQLAENNVYVYKVYYTGKDGKGHNLTGSVTLVK
ncbi:MAG: PKD domain-containing protein [Bacteroidota bacterium]|nr:PKD domain-containing protein [Bacteroidota bacterium]